MKHNRNNSEHIDDHNKRNSKSIITVANLMMSIIILSGVMNTTAET